MHSFFSRLGMQCPKPVTTTLASLLIVLLAGCGGGSSGTAPTPVAVDPVLPTLSSKAQLGAQIFVDTSLSGSGQQSCASCHDPKFFHGPPNNLAVQPGGADGTQTGQRAAPSLRYLHLVPGFNPGDGLPDNLRGGLMADGRVDTLAQQARLPFLNPREMDNRDVATLANRLRRTRYAAQFSSVFGAAATDEDWVNQAADALMAFQVEDPQFHPFDSKFDLTATGRIQPTRAEQAGFTVFVDVTTGNCQSCHALPNGIAPKAPFTNFGYAALGVPRNSAVPANADPQYFDLGVCSPFRTGVTRNDWCGLFRTPTLRNTAKRPVFFHNGFATTLDQVLDFYNTRDSHPERWYPLINGRPDRFNDLPQALRGNVNTLAPFGSVTPRMSAQQLSDLKCFLETLTDGYVPGTPPSPGC